MAKYGIETEVTTHLKGMTFGESSDNQSSMGGGYNPIVLDLDKERCHFADNDDIIVVDSDEFFMTEIRTQDDNYLQRRVISACSCPLIKDILIEFLSIGMDMDDVGIPESLRTFFYLASDCYDVYFNDTMVCMSAEENEYPGGRSSIMSKDAYCWDKTASLIIQGDTRPVDEILNGVKSEVDMFDWSTYNFCTTMVIPRYGADFQVSLMRKYISVLHEYANSSTYSLRKSGNPLLGGMISRI